MTPELLLVVVGFFVSIALLAGLGASVVLGRTAPERRRLNEMAAASASAVAFGTSEQIRLTEQLDPRLERIAKRIPKSPKEMTKLRRRLAQAGITSFGAAVFYSISELTLPFVFAAPPLMYMMPPMAWLAAAVLAMIGYMIPGLTLGYLIKKQKLKIENGLPDALDLMIVCVEAGTGLDQAIQKTSIELEISHPELASELRLITTEIRAGKTRIEAFKNFAERTKVEDVRSLVAMLVQTDRFGTSIAAGAADPRRDVTCQASSARRRAGGEDRREARLSAGVLLVPGVLRRHAWPGGHSVRPGVLWTGGSVTNLVERRRADYGQHNEHRFVGIGWGFPDPVSDAATRASSRRRLGARVSATRARAAAWRTCAERLCERAEQCVGRKVRSTWSAGC